MRKAAFMAAALALVLTAACNKDNTARANSGSTVGTAGRAESGLSSGDRDFVRDVAEMNMGELALGRLASQRAADANVKQFAQMVVTDHTASGDKLKAFASQHNIEVPTQISDKDRDLQEKLSGKQGLDFDKEYADAMVDRHQALVDKLESRIDKDTLTRATNDNKNGPDTKVKATAVMPEKSDDANTMALNQWAADTYPVAYAHLQAAKDLRDGVRKRSTN